MNRGARRLHELFPERGGTKSIAEKLGVLPSVVSRWIRGERKPDPKQRASLEDEYGVGWRLWDEEVDDDPESEPKPKTKGDPTIKAAAS